MNSTHQYNAAAATLTHLLEQFPGIEEREHIVLDIAAIYVAQGRFDEALQLSQQVQQGGRLPALAAYRHVPSQFAGQSHWAVTAWFRAGEIYEVLQ